MPICAVVGGPGLKPDNQTTYTQSCLHAAALNWEAAGSPCALVNWTNTSHRGTCSLLPTRLVNLELKGI